MTENFSNCKRINQIFPTNFSDICSGEPKILLILDEIFLYFPKIFLIIYPKYSQNLPYTLYTSHSQNFQNILLENFINNRTQKYFQQIFQKYLVLQKFRRIFRRNFTKILAN